MINEKARIFWFYVDKIQVNLRIDEIFKFQIGDNNFTFYIHLFTDRKKIFTQYFIC